MAGSAAFFAPLISTRPDNGTPPTTRILSIAFPGNYTTGQTLQIFQNRPDHKPGARQQLPERIDECRVDLEQQMAPRAQPLPGLGEKAGVDLGSGAAPEESQVRLVVNDRPIQSSGICAGQVREVADDEIERRFGSESFQKIATHEFDPAVGSVPGNVLARHGEGGWTYVGGAAAGTRHLVCKRNGDTARPGAHIDEADCPVAAFIRQGHSPFYELLRLRARDEHSRIHRETEAVELLPAGDVLEWDAGRAPLHERRVLIPMLPGERLRK
jgi:hypothetical protein